MARFNLLRIMFPTVARNVLSDATGAGSCCDNVIMSSGLRIVPCCDDKGMPSITGVSRCDDEGMTPSITGVSWEAPNTSFQLRSRSVCCCKPAAAPL